VRELDRRRVEPSLVLLDGADTLSRSLEPADCPVLRLGVTKLMSRDGAAAAGRLRSFWQEARPDVLQVYFLDSAYFAVPLALLFGIPKVVRVRNNLGYWLTRKHRLLNRVIGPLTDVTLTNTDAGRDALVATEGLRPDRVAVIANGVDVERFDGLPPPFSWGGPIRVGCVANLRPVKNIDGLMRAARRVCERCPDVVFEVAGDGNQRPELERLHAELGLGNRFVLRGSVSDVPRFLGSVGLAVLPSHSEGMSNALLEAMAAGRGIVATAVGANPQLVTDGEHGLIVPPGDEPALTAAIERLVRDPELAGRLGRAARSRVEHEYSREAMRRRFEAFYEKLVRGQPTAVRSS
jgi:glycosyltransferase involved in cell wall biosynthesis